LGFADGLRPKPFLLPAVKNIGIKRAAYPLESGKRSVRRSRPPQIINGLDGFPSEIERPTLDAMTMLSSPVKPEYSAPVTQHEQYAVAAKFSRSPNRLILADHDDTSLNWPKGS
jgi:hypothetical protein